MDVAFFEITEEKKKYLSERIVDCELFFYEKTIDEYELRDFEVISVRSFSKINSDVLDKLPSLKLILTRTTGFDHIDLEECDKRGIKVANVPAYGENTVAEHAMALLLSISRNIHKSYENVLVNKYPIIEGFDLQNKTLGVIGTGHIGQHMIRMAKGFEMNVKAFDIYHNDEIANRLGFEYVGLDELMKTSDIISLHCPYNLHTHHILNQEKLNMTKNGVVIINTARGALIDTKVLYELVKSNHILACGLDVIEEEDKILGCQDSEFNSLIEHENVLFTPHNGFNSKESIIRILDKTIENLQEFIDGKELSCQVLNQHH